MKNKYETRKWRYGIRIGKCPARRNGFSPFIEIWFLRFISLPPDGEMISKENYKGFRLYFEPLSYFLIVMYRFKVGKRYFSLPIGIKFL